MKHTTADGGVGSGDGRGESALRGRRSVSKILRVKDGLNILPRGQRSSGLRGGVERRCSTGWLARPASMATCPSGRGAEGSAPPTPRRRGRVGADLGGARALVSVMVRGSVGAVQPEPMSYGGEGSERRRRGRLGGEVAVSNQHKVKAGRGLGRVVSSSLLVGGSAMAPGSAQNSLSNNRLKLPARGRSGAESLRRTRAAV